jgi:hypothetical protein
MLALQVASKQTPPLDEFGSYDRSLAGVERGINFRPLLGHKEEE